MEPNYHKEHEKKNHIPWEGTKKVRTIFQFVSIFKSSELVKQKMHFYG